MLIEEILIAPFKIQESQLLMIERRLPYFEASSHLMKEIQSVRVIIRGVYFVPKLYNCPKRVMKIFIIAPNLHVACNEIS